VARRRIPQVRDDRLAPLDAGGGELPTLPVGSAAWFAWLAEPAHVSFAYAGTPGRFTARREQRHGRGYWYAYRRQDGRLRKQYLGPPDELTPARLATVAARLAAAPADSPPRHPGAGPAHGTPPRRAAVAARRAGSPPAPALPTVLTTFVGREREIAQLTELLPTTRLLTLTGAGGSGKTRLAIEVARRHADAYPDGIWLVELATLSDPTLVPQAVARVLGIRERAPQPMRQTLVEALQARQAFIVLDNCEHLAAACADLAEALLRACPELRLLVTSRAVLNVAGEVTWRAPALGLPSHASPPSVAQVAASEAVQLFLDRARAVQPAFALTEQNAAAVATICTRLDGLPLAIELAAARLSVLSTEQLAARLTDRFALLTTGRQTALPHHRTLRAAMEWSFDLLDEADRDAFICLASFAGGFTLEAAEYVCEGEAGKPGSGEDGASASPPRFPASPLPPSSSQPPRLPASHLDVLARLVDRSLVVAESGRADVQRYRLLETVRAFAWERLQADGRAGLVQRRHAEYFTNWVERVTGDRAGRGEATWLEQVAAEHDNLRAALRWALEQQEPPLAVRLTAALHDFWWLQGSIIEARQWLAAVLRLVGPAPTRERAQALLRSAQFATVVGEFAPAAGWLEEVLLMDCIRDDPLTRALVLRERSYIRFMAGDYVAAAADNVASLALFRQVDDPVWTGRALTTLAVKVWVLGETARATTALDEARRLLSEAGSPVDLAATLSQAGHFALASGDVGRARAYYEECLTIRRASGATFGLAGPLAGLAAVALAEGDLPAAAERHRQALEFRQREGDRGGISLSLDGLAALAAAQRQPATAARLYAAAAALRAALRMPAPILPAFGEMVERQIAAVRRRLGPAAFAAAWAAGQALSADAACAVALAVAEAALAEPPAARAAVTIDGLTRREREVIDLLLRGDSNRAIAAALSRSERTIEGHVSRILDKLGLTSRAQIAVWAVQQGLIGPGDAAPLA
jgi:predicted ATPase/DNA-binding CsgD family transcriptional regulator